MTHSDAIKTLSNIRHLRTVFVADIDAINLAIESLEKQIPKKVKGYEDEYMHCPKCKKALGYKWKKYPAEKEYFSWLRFCWSCGQAIDWEGVDDE